MGNSLSVKQVRQEFDKNPSGYIFMIVENNPKAVADKLHALYSRATIPGDVNSIINELQDLLKNSPNQAKSILKNVLSVPVVTKNNIYDNVAQPLNAVGQELYLDLAIEYDLKNQK